MLVSYSSRWCSNFRRFSDSDLIHHAMIAASTSLFVLLIDYVLFRRFQRLLVKTARARALALVRAIICKWKLHLVVFSSSSLKLVFEVSHRAFLFVLQLPLRHTTDPMLHVDSVVLYQSRVCGLLFRPVTCWTCSRLQVFCVSWERSKTRRQEGNFISAQIIHRSFCFRYVSIFFNVQYLLSLSL